MRIDNFSGDAASLKKRDRTHENVLAALGRNPRVSTWDMSEHAWLRSILKDLERGGQIIEDDHEPYPWHRFVVQAA